MIRRANPLLGGVAVFSDDLRFRYALERTWQPTQPAVTFVMLNPSTADEEQTDPTVARCLAFARAWGFGALLVANAYAFRATDPREMYAAQAAGIDITGGDDNEKAIRGLCERSSLVVCAWGTKIESGREARMLEILSSDPFIGALYCLRRTKDGHPEHPLYLPSETEPQIWAQRGIRGR